MKQIIYGFLFVVCFCTTLIGFEHDPPTHIEDEKPVRLIVRTPKTANYSIRCFYKFNEDAEYRVLNLNQLSSRTYQIQLSIPDNTKYLDYYFWVYKNNNFLSTLPTVNPQNSPYSILNTSANIRYFTILSPDPSKKIRHQNKLIIMLRNNFPKLVDITNVVFNDDEPVNILKQQSKLVTLQSSAPLRKGKNRLTITGLLNDGTVINQTFQFSVKRMREVNRESYGSVSLDHMSYDTNKTAYKAYEPFDIKYLSKYHSKYKFSNINLYGLFDSRDSVYTQPYSRYSAQFVDPLQRWSVKLGDSTYHYTPLSVNGRRVRGIKTDINLLGFMNTTHRLKFSMLYGNSNKAIEVSSGNVTTGTYEQKVSGGQLTYSNMTFKSSIQYFKIKDVEESLSSVNAGSTTPIENQLLGLYLKFRPTPLIKVENEFVAGAYYSDSRASTVNIDEFDIDASLKSLIEQHLPIKTTLTAGYANKFSTQFPLKDRNTILRMTHDWIHPSFVNVLNSSIESDKNQLTVDLIQKLFNRRLILSSQVKRKQNNILNTLSETTHTNSYRIGSTIRTKDRGMINLTAMLTRRDQEVTTANSIIDNQLNYVLLGWTGIPLPAIEATVKGQVNISLSEYNDFYADSNSTQTTSYGTRLNAKLNGYLVSMGINQSLVNSNTSGKTNYITLITSAQKSMLETMVLGTKVKLISGHNSNEHYKQSSIKLINSWDLDFSREQYWIFSKSTFYWGVDLTYMVDSEDKDNENVNFYELFVRFKMVNSF